MKTLVNWLYWIAVSVILFLAFGTWYSGDAVIPAFTGRIAMYVFYGVMFLMITVARVWVLDLISTTNQIIEKAKS